MTDGTSQGLFIVVAIVIFGIFTVLAYILFEDTLSPALANMFSEATEQASERLNKTDIPTEVAHLKYVVNSGEVTITGFNDGLPENVVIPSHIDDKPVTIIGPNAFSKAGISTIQLPDTLKHIQSHAFMSNELKSLALPVGLESMAIWSFAHNNITDVSLPDNAIFGMGTFAHNVDTKLHINDTNTLYKLVDGVLYSKDGKTLVYYPQRTDKKAFIVPEGVETIGNRAIEHTVLEDITLPRTLKVIDWYGLYYNKFKALELPEGLTTIGSYAFVGNYDLVSINIPSTVTSVNSTAFEKTKIKFEELGL